MRILGGVPTLLGVSLLTFLFIRLIPGDAIAARLGTSTSLTPEQLASLRAYFGLDQPLIVQYWNWLTSLLRGDAGISIRTGRPVFVEIIERLPATLELAAAAALIAIGIGIPLGLLSAVRPRSGLDILVRIGGLIGLSLPRVGRMLPTAITQRDYALVQGTVLVIALLFGVVNIVVDLLYGYLDPRIRLA